jgi:hypothetical protein
VRRRGPFVVDYRRSGTTGPPTSPTVRWGEEDAMLRQPLLGRAGASALLAGSGLLLIAASRARWWPDCRFQDFDTPACLERQDHLYDFLPPADPWAQAGDSATLAGASLVLLAVAFAVLPTLLVGSLPRTLTWGVGAALSLGVLAGAAATALSGWQDHVVAGPASGGALVLWALGWPMSMVILWVMAADASPRRGPWWRVAVVALVAAASPLGHVFLGPVVVGYASHDTTP